MISSLRSPLTLREAGLQLPPGLSEQETRGHIDTLAAADRVPGPASFLGGGLLPPLRPGRRAGADLSQRVRHRLHPVPAGSEPGDPRAHLRVPDLRLRAHRHGRSQRLPLRRPLGAGRRQLSWPCARPDGKRWRCLRACIPRPGWSLATYASGPGIPLHPSLSTRVAARRRRRSRRATAAPGRRGARATAQLPGGGRGPASRWPRPRTQAARSSLCR